MENPRIAIIVGSNRRDSINRKLAVALGKLMPNFDIDFLRIDDLPMYGQDGESPIPAPVARLKNEIARADGVIVVTPEHNRSIPALLKNAIDWAGRPYGQNSWSGKPVFITGTSPGPLGAALAQQHLRSILGSFLGAQVLGGEAYITFKPGLIDDQGQIADESTRKFLQGFLEQLATLAVRHAPQPERFVA